MSERSLYEILGVDEDAEPADVRRAYRRLARRHHPDLNPGDPEATRRFRVICRAFLVLSRPSRRAVYDSGGTPVVTPTEVERQLESPFETVSSRRAADVAAELFGHGEPREEGIREQDATTELTLALAEAVRGAAVDVSLQRESPCEDCDGSGETEGGEPCPRCSGRGVLVALERLRVRVPPGTEDGDRLRVPGHGHLRSSGTGDLYLLVRVDPHPYYRRRGADIHAELPVTVAEAALGAEIEVPTIDGPVRMRLPAGTESGTTFRLKGRGVVPGREGERGDHYATVRIVPPPDPDPDTRAALEELRQPDPRRDLPREL